MQARISFAVICAVSLDVGGRGVSVDIAIRVVLSSAPCNTLLKPTRCRAEGNFVYQIAMIG
jgi:hypothetical protein